MKKRLRSAAYGFAHHCQSGLSFIQPHLSDTLRTLNLERLEVTFLPSFSISPEIDDGTPLKTALTTAGGKLEHILSKHQISAGDIARATATFWRVDGSGYRSSVEVVLTAADGAIISRKL
jgi:hypothetical protein